LLWINFALRIPAIAVANHGLLQRYEILLRAAAWKLRMTPFAHSNLPTVAAKHGLRLSCLHPFKLW
jgi:hypothetical protein